jgi:hypothetical protein
MKKTLTILIFTFTFSQTFAQVDNLIGAYSGKNGEGFLQPLANVLTSSFNTGTAHKTSIDSGFHVYLGVIATQSFIIGGDLKYFTGTTPDFFSPMQDATTSTIFGPNQITTVEGLKSTSYSFPAGMGVKWVRLATPQITIGSFFGTEISLRYFGYNVNDDFGKITIMGGGLRHDIGRYFLPKKSKFKITAEAFFQELKTGRYSTSQMLKAGVYAGQQTKKFHYFAYAGYQQGKTNIVYKNTDENIDFNVNLKNSNPLIFGVGAGAKFGILNIHGQANFLSPTVVAVGIGLNF